MPRRAYEVSWDGGKTWQPATREIVQAAVGSRLAEDMERGRAKRADRVR